MIIPQTGVRRNPVGSSRAYISLCIFVSFSLRLFVRSSAYICGDHSRGPWFSSSHAAAGHGVKSPEFQYNMSVRPFWLSGRLRSFLWFLYLYSFPVWGSSLSRCAYPHTGVRRNPVGFSRDYIYVRLSLYLSVSLYLCLSVSLSLCLSASLYDHTCRYLSIISSASNYAQRMRPQATGSNTLSGSIIFPSVRPSVHPSICPSVCPYVCPVVRRTFSNFCILY